MPLVYPETLYRPQAATDLSSDADRERLSTPALKAFFKMVEHFAIKVEDARKLLGGISNGPYYEMRNHPDDYVLSQDELLRVSFLVGIFKALHILHGHNIADRWLQLENANVIFGGKTPLQYMVQGGLPAMETVRRLLDARRGGGS